jgi:hypothetical protein
VKRPFGAVERLTRRRSRARHPSVTIEELVERHSHYLMDQQIGLHGTMVSIALGVSGLAAASLFDVSPADRPYRLLFWLLWFTSLVAVGTVYSGMTVNVYALPSTIPSAVDMFLPVGVGLMEFMLFAVLTSPLNSQLSPRSVVVVWSGCFCLFGCLASLVIIRVRWLFKHTVYELSATQVAIYDVVKLLLLDLRGASGSALVGAATALLIGLVPAVSLAFAYLSATLLIIGMSFAVVNQRHQAAILEVALSRLLRISSTPRSKRLNQRGQKLRKKQLVRPRSRKRLIDAEL